MRTQIPWQLLQSEFFLGALLCRLCFHCMAFSFFQLYLDFWLNLTSSLFTHQLILADISFLIGKLGWFCFLLWWASVLPYPFHSVHICPNFFGCVNALHYCYSSSGVVHFSCIVYLLILLIFVRLNFAWQFENSLSVLWICSDSLYFLICHCLPSPKCDVSRVFFSLLF